MSPQITFQTDGVVTDIRIRTGPPPRLVIEGVQRDTASGATLRSFSEDVTDLLTPAQKAALTTIATRAQAWVDSKL